MGAIHEIGFEIAIAIQEVGAMLINVGWEQTFAANRRVVSIELAYKSGLVQPGAAAST